MTSFILVQSSAAQPCVSRTDLSKFGLRGSVVVLAKGEKTISAQVTVEVPQR